MSAFVSRLSAPVAGAILLGSLVLAPSVSAAPLAAAKQFQAPQDTAVVQIHHKKRPGKHGGRGWNGGYGHGHYALGPRQIRRSLRHRGFYRIKIVDRRGPMYIVRAVGWRGMPVRLVVDSRTAHIVRSRPIGRGIYWQYNW